MVAATDPAEAAELAGAGRVVVFRGPATRGALHDLGVRGAALAGRAFVSDDDPAGRASAADHGPAIQHVQRHEAVQRKCARCDDEVLLQREALPHAQPAAAALPARSDGATAVIVDDAAHAGPGQVTHGAFMALVRAQVTATCDEELARIGRTAADCPYLRYWLDYYDRRSAHQLERALEVYTGVRARAPEALVEAVVGRVRAAVRIWAQTGRVTGIPSVAPTEAEASASSMASGSAPSTPSAVRARLGSGHPLDGGVRARMERGFGRGFEAVRVHTDANAAGLAASLRARAFTIGSDIAFAAGEFQPTTLEGESLLAHELAHTIQQEGASPSTSRIPMASTNEALLERDADRAALGAMASLRGGGAQLVGMMSSPAPERTSGLALQRCSNDEKLPEAAVGPIPDYDSFSNPDGTIPPDKERALGAMFQNPDQLDRVFADAASGNQRAVRIFRDLHADFEWLGRDIAEKEFSADCMIPAWRELKGAVMTGCVPNWSFLNFLRADRPGGLALREDVARAYSRRSRELGVRNEIIAHGLNLLLAGWMARAALAGEASALGVKPAAPEVRPPPARVAAPEGATAAEAARQLGLPAVPEGYYWTKTGGTLTPARRPGRTDLPKIRYDPATRTFVDEAQFARLKPAVVRPSIPPAELEQIANQAVAARDALKGVPTGKTGAGAPDGTVKISGWGSDISSLDPVRKLSRKIGHEPPPNPALDARGQPGSYNLSHAEKQLAAARPGAPIGVSREMCMDCQHFFKRLANHRGEPVIVADPTGVRVFYPDGRVISGKTAAALAGAAAAADTAKE